ncbi:MAG: TetR family transcriptional regulator [Spirochaetaceae bacterium]
MDWKRATTEDKKNERKVAIYNAAFKLFKKKDYNSVSFNGIASEAGFTKSNMYRYFNSKEEIFLNIFAELFEKWSDDCIKDLQNLEQNVDANSFAKTWVNTLLSHQQFLDLTPILFLSLEKNSSYEQLFKFKKLSKNLLHKIAMKICRIYPELDGIRAFNFLDLSYSAMSHFWAKSTNNETLKKIYSQDIFKELKPNFEKDLISSIEIIIHGIRFNKTN